MYFNLKLKLENEEVKSIELKKQEKSSKVVTIVISELFGKIEYKYHHTNKKDYIKYENTQTQRFSSLTKGKISRLIKEKSLIFETLNNLEKEYQNHMINWFKENEEKIKDNISKIIELSTHLPPHKFNNQKFPFFWKEDTMIINPFINETLTNKVNPIDYYSKEKFIDYLEQMQNYMA